MDKNYTKVASSLLAQELGDLELANPIKPGSYSAQRISSASGATLVQIAFDADVELAEHKAATPIIVQVLDGQVDFSVGDQTHQLSYGGMIQLEAGVVHAVYAENPARILITFIDV
ncbi:hypothetical protein CQ010_13070 [Arthrobacter sp. MYb211]|uniref:cupin domain-containing protein n=1 Tax=Micrococcaceae TaxID=1268 RepID=UPI000CFABF6A|nr:MULTISPECIES: cupin domain-containing protein [unclassified Arthrobacter]PRA00503.1 hypothetical protein CQ017_05640 [Arthrobacter sp. MYb224]PRA04695.1 hypothetical protein CQ019_10340 [Arthrobacter sp. MYb229]PRA10663.1 hypothetical protein CQ015_13060 [Arthrobacter sp. MYb221]PRB51391.1 hypothetical protein CQ013_06225 [Arthrobacter sp. MYb216]PRC06356.1 hypothetical protein CQ010_13070 [Arthrobacter sp. MYb211]